MKKIVATLFLILFCFNTGIAQDFTSQLYRTYNNYKETSLKNRRFKHADLLPLMQRFENHLDFKVQQVGESIEGRSIFLISAGTGAIDIFLWSQMHGDEPTATQAIFDILNFLDAPSFQKEKQAILSKVKLHFLPMLNPDGAERFMRRNALGIDVNRDALRLQSPEGRILKRMRDSLKADFGFNLHDQSRYYNAERSGKPATISYLAPAYNYEKQINTVRGNAMKVIVYMNRIIQKYAPGQVGRYSDHFEPRAFGDNIQKWGTSAILIESGGSFKDLEKQEIRKLNYVSILSAIYAIANGTFKNMPLEEYETIPNNDRKLFDLKIKNLTYNLHGKDYQIDIGIKHLEVDDTYHETFHNQGIIADQGDLSTHYGYTTFDATGYKAVPPMIASIEAQNELESTADFNDLLQSGYAYLATNEDLRDRDYASPPFHLIADDLQLPRFNLAVGKNPTFFLEKNGSITHAVINGFLIDLKKGIDSNFKNTLIYK